LIKFFFKLFFIFNLLLIQVSQSSETNNLVFIDMDYLIKNAEIGKKTLKILDTKNSTNLKILKEKEVKLKKQETELQNKKNIISSEEFNNEIKVLKIKINELRNEKKQLAIDFNKFKNEEFNKLLNKYNVVIQEYMKKNSIDIILDKKNIYIGKVSSDITEPVLQQINTKYK
tara:strand:- start:1661 stop:2176 length:516 start_codon:yes stop_codon:yes gene_type:complete